MGRWPPESRAKEEEEDGHALTLPGVFDLCGNQSRPGKSSWLKLLVKASIISTAQLASWCVVISGVMINLPLLPYTLPDPWACLRGRLAAL